MDDDASKKTALLVAVLSSFLNPFMASSVNIALPSIGKEFAVDAVLLSWIPTVYILTAATFLVPSGRIADIHGRKKVFTWGISIFTVSTLLLTASTSIGMLIAFRVLQGIGTAMIFGASVAILTSVFPASERGKALGMTVAAVYSGLSASSPRSVAAVSWRRSRGGKSGKPVLSHESRPSPTPCPLPLPTWEKEGERAEMFSPENFHV